MSPHFLIKMLSIERFHSHASKHTQKIRFIFSFNAIDFMCLWPQNIIKLFGMGNRSRAEKLIIKICLEKNLFADQKYIKILFVLFRRLKRSGDELVLNWALFFPSIWTFSGLYQLARRGSDGQKISKSQNLRFRSHIVCFEFTFANANELIAPSDRFFIHNLVVPHFYAALKTYFTYVKKCCSRFCAHNVPESIRSFTSFVLRDLFFCSFRSFVSPYRLFYGQFFSSSNSSRNFAEKKTCWMYWIFSVFRPT